MHWFWRLVRGFYYGCITLDLFLIEATKWVVDWADEWLSLSQSRIEEGLIVAYAATHVLTFVHSVMQNPRDYGSWLPIGVAVYLTYWMWDSHRKPRAVRAFMRWRFPFLRLIWFFFSLVFLGPVFYVRNVWMLAVVFPFYPLLGFQYVLVCGGDGQSGRRRKLALAKLKEWFGVGWLPEPEGTH